MVRAPRVVQRNLTTQDESKRADRHGGEEQAAAAAAQPFAPIHPLASRVPDVHFEEIPLQRLAAFGLCGTSNLEGIIAKSDFRGKSTHFIPCADRVFVPNFVSKALDRKKEKANN